MYQDLRVLRKIQRYFFVLRSISSNDCSPRTAFLQVDKQSEKLKEDVRALCKEWSKRAEDKDTEIEGAIRPYEGKDKRRERVEQLRAAGGIKNLEEADQLEQEIKGTHRMLLIDTISWHGVSSPSLPGPPPGPRAKQLWRKGG